MVQEHVKSSTMPYWNMIKDSSIDVKRELVTLLMYSIQKTSVNKDAEFVDVMMQSINDIAEGKVWDEDELIKEELRTMPWLFE